MLDRIFIFSFLDLGLYLIGFLLTFVELGEYLGMFLLVLFY